MKRILFSTFLVFITILTMVRCTDPEIDAYEGTDLSSHNATATYFNYGSYTHFIVSFTDGSNTVSLQLCSAELSTSDEKIVQAGTYPYSSTFGENVLGKLSTLNNKAIKSGSVTIKKDFLTYTISGTLDGSTVSYTGYILTVTDVNVAMKVNACVDANNTLTLSDADGNSLTVPYSGSFVGTLSLDSSSYYTTVAGNTQTVNEGTLTITENSGVYNISGSVLTNKSVGATISGQWSNETIINGTISATGTDQSSYNNSYWSVAINDNSGFTLNIIIMADFGATYYSEEGTTLSVLSTWANNTIVAGYDWGSWGSGGTVYTVNGTSKYITDGTLTFTSSDGITVTVTGTISDGTNSYEISGTYNDGSSSSISLNLFAHSDYTAYGYSNTFKFVTEGVTATYNSSTYSYTYTGSGYYLSVDFTTAIAAGTYTAEAKGSAGTTNFITSYDSGYGSLYGTVFGVISDGTIVEDGVTGGTVTITESSGIYTMTFDLVTESGEAVKASYTGSL